MRIALVHLCSFGDCLYATLVARQIKSDFPGAHLTWVIGDKFAPLLIGNPHVDVVQVIPIESVQDALHTAWIRACEWAERRAKGDRFEKIFYTQILPKNAGRYDGSVRSTIYRAYPGKVEPPHQPLFYPTQEELEKVQQFARTHDLAGFKHRFLFECGPQSHQSPMTPSRAEALAHALAKSNPDAAFILSSSSPVSNPSRQVIDASGLAFRENAALTHYCTALIGCSSGITWLCTATGSSQLPMLQIITTETRKAFSFASVATDFQRFGLSSTSVIEMADPKDSQITDCISLWMADTHAAARSRYHEDIHLTSRHAETTFVAIREDFGYPSAISSMFRFVISNGKSTIPWRFLQSELFVYARWILKKITQVFFRESSQATRAKASDQSILSRRAATLPKGDIKPSILIIAPDANAWSQPLTRSIVRSLSKDFEVHILGHARHAKDAVLPALAHVELVDPQSQSLRSRLQGIYLALFAIATRLFLPKISFSRASIPKLKELALLAARIRKHKAAHVIAIDASAALASQLAGRRCHLLLLEILHNDLAYLSLQRPTVLSVITQNKLRYLATFAGSGAPFFFVPNFPAFKERPLAAQRRGYVFAGTALPGFGAIHCLNYVAQYSDVELSYRGSLPESFLALVNGAAYSELVRSGRVTIDHHFQEEDAYIQDLSSFEIGFAFYDLTEADRDFSGLGKDIGATSIQNYLTGAAGKIGNCCAAGVPVIASALPGLAFVEEYKVGILIVDHRPETIRKAAIQILADHESFRRNCLKLAEHFAFDSHFNAFKEAMLKLSPTCPNQSHS